MEMLMLQQATGMSTQELSTEAIRSLSGVGAEEVSDRLIAGLYDRPAEREAAVDNKPPSSSSASPSYSGLSPRDALQPADQLILDQAIELLHVSSGAVTPLPSSAVVEVLHLANSDDSTRRSSLQNLGAKSPEQLRTVAVSLQLEEAVRLTKVLQPAENYDASTAAVMISGNNQRRSDDVLCSSTAAAALLKEKLSHLSVNVKDKASSSSSFKQSNAENALYAYSSKSSVPVPGTPTHSIDGAASINAAATAAWIPPLLHEMDEIIRVLVPSPSALAERLKVFRYVRNLVSASLGVQLFPVGSLVSQTFLPDADMESSAFIIRKDDESWFVLVNEALCMSNETRMSKYNSFDSLPSQQSDEDINITNVSFVNGPIKKIRIMINSIGVEITMNQIGALYSEYLIEQIDQFVGQNHLFKRSLLLVEMWCIFESPRHTQGAGSMVLRSSSSSSNDGSGSSDSNRLNSWAVTIMLISIFNLEGARISHPLQALGHFLRIFSSFDWHKYAVSVKGKVYADDLRVVVCQDTDAAAGIDVGHHHHGFFPDELLDKFYESDEDKIATAAELAAAAAVSAEESQLRQQQQQQQSIMVGEVPIIHLDIPQPQQQQQELLLEGDDKLLLLGKQIAAAAFPPPVSYFTKGIKYNSKTASPTYQQGLITIIDPVRGNSNVAQAISVDGYQIITSALYEGYRSFQTMCESFVIARSPRNINASSASPQHATASSSSSATTRSLMAQEQQLTEQEVLKIIRILFANTQLKVVSWDPHFKKTVVVLPDPPHHHPTTTTTTTIAAAAAITSRSYLDIVHASKPLQQRFPTLRCQPDDIEVLDDTHHPPPSSTIIAPPSSSRHHHHRTTIITHHHNCTTPFAALFGAVLVAIR